jgi:hypothetical protein
MTAASPLRLKDIALGVLFFAVVIAAVYFLILAPAKERAKARVCESHFKAIISASKDYAREHGTGIRRI